ncbi:MAG TPA: bifunctional serine/threonine-protein kinase/formylglycine-generating enzyme family protein [Blastocatellia bacterium]|nr:bifunctional serine/threonine-protein kinase/formylglycine-generating enzyme family protein [Blastocatellia bacterium]
MIGRVIGNYEVIKQFGEGGMGELYIGRHTRLAREVVIKTIRTEDFSPRQIEHLRERLEREAFVQSQLDHANIVRVYDFIASGDATCIVMEYVPGRDLRKMISRETGPIAEPRAIKLFKQVLAAVDYAHHFVYSDQTGEKHQGIIHRDLKPANILVTPTDLAKVTDFGIVKVRGVQGGTQMGFNPGTPEYMSPEQARGRELDQRSDIYSLGIVFYEMLTGRVPFEDDGGTSDYEIRRGHIELPVPTLTKFYPGVSAEVEKVVLKALEKSPDHRFQTTRQFLEAIEEYEFTGAARPTLRISSGPRQTVVQDGRQSVRQNLPADLADSPTRPPNRGLTAEFEQEPVQPTNFGTQSVPTVPMPTSNYEGYGRPTSVVEPRPSTLLQAAAPRSKLPLVIAAAVGVVLICAAGFWFLTRSEKPSNSAVTAPTPNGANLSSQIPDGMNLITAGDFTMGRDNGNEYERPAHKVSVAAFYLDTNEVTNSQYQDFVRQMRRRPPKNWSGDNYPPGQANFPVVYVSWLDARDYCLWKGGRLPTEEEWEYAARGTENRLYPYGNQWQPKFSNASSADQPGSLSAVGSYPAGASPFGIFDLAGNVAEWTASDYQPYPGSTARPDEGNKVIRGGSFKNPAIEQIATDRYFDVPAKTLDYIGFRCAKNVK